MIPLKTRLLYGTSRLGAEALGKSQALWLLYYYAPPKDANPHLPTLLPSLAVGALLTVGGIVGALDDAIVGWFSDRTRSRWGRRIPYIVIGAPLWSIFFVLIFVPPASASHAVTAVYLFVVFEVLTLCSAIVIGPYEALTPEMAATSKDRVGIQAVKVYLGVLGTGVGLVGSSFLVHHVGFRTMAVSFAGFALICQYLAIGGVWGRARQSHIPAEIGFRDALRTTFQNRGFRILLPSVVLFALAVTVLIADTPYYVHDVVGKHSWLSPTVMLTVAFVSALAFVPVFIRLAARTSKRRAYRLSMLAAAATFPLLTLAGVIPGIPPTAQILVAVALIGAPLGAHYLFPIPLTSDVIDDDSAKTKQRREATYLGASSFVERVATSVAPLLVALLGLAGNTRGDTLGVRLVGVLGGALILAAWYIFRAYDVPDEVRGRVPPEAVILSEAAPLPAGT
jgi:glycoside/pentoside/hexuronide:cation symporter, GPH family